MKKIKILFKLLLCVSLPLVFLLGGCSNDVTRELKLGYDYQNKDFKKDGIGELTIFKYEDGDTLFFNSVDGPFKVRFLGNDTPETVGTLEPFGKAASKFTYNKLKDSKKIVVESTNVGEPAEFDNYRRYLGFVWYIPAGEEDFVNLNLEIVRAGYSKCSNMDKYQDYFKKAEQTAKKDKIGIWSENDPNYPTTVTNTTIKDLSTNFDKFDNKLVKFQGYVVEKYKGEYDTGETAVVEALDQDGKTYRVNIYMHNDGNESIFCIGNLTEFVGYATNFHGNKRITGVVLPGYRDEASRIIQRGYYLQFGFITNVIDDRINHVYSEVLINEVHLKDGITTIIGTAKRNKKNINVVIYINGNEVDASYVGKSIKVAGYSKKTVTATTIDVELEVKNSSGIILDNKA